MSHLRYVVVVCVLGFVAGTSPAADSAVAPLMTASGVVKKATPNVLLVLARGAGGRFGNEMTLKIRGTSKISTLVPQTRGGQVVLTQRETDAKDLEANQPIAVIYVQVKGEYVLLTAVAQSTAGR